MFAAAGLIKDDVSLEDQAPDKIRVSAEASDPFSHCGHIAGCWSDSEGIRGEEDGQCVFAYLRASLCEGGFVQQASWLDVDDLFVG